MPSHWSGVVYLAAEEARDASDPEDSGGLLEFVNPHPMGRHSGQQQTISFAPKDGLVILFPAFLVHYVHPNGGDATRVSLSFNLDIALD
jgi:uncharacterized protein (TIGR02466 family)